MRERYDENFTVVQCYFCILSISPPKKRAPGFRARVTYLGGSRLIGYVKKKKNPMFGNRTHRRVGRSSGARKSREIRLLRTDHTVALLEFRQGWTELRPGSSRPHRHVSDPTSQPLATARATLRPR